MTVKVQVTMDEALLQRLDEYADRSFNTRSGAVSLAVSQLLMQDDLQRSIRTMALAMQRIAENNEIDEESKKQLFAFQSLARMYSEGVR